MSISDLFPSAAEGGYGDVQLVFLLCVYGYILFKGSNYIAEGSELLTLVMSPGLVGGLVLPVMGAVPDGAIVLFSGLGPDAQENLNVGVGTLAGSTIMLLTVPWALCAILGRVDLVKGVLGYNKKPKLTQGCSLTRTGTGASKDVSINGKIMLLTTIPFLIIQGPAFKYFHDKNAGEEEKYFALAGFILSLLLFLGYSWFMVRSANALEQQKLKFKQLRTRAFQARVLSLPTLHNIILSEETTSGGDNSAPLLDGSGNDRVREALRPALRKMFQKWDHDKNGHIDLTELRELVHEAGMPMSDNEVQALMRQVGGDDLRIDFQEFETFIHDFFDTSRGGVGHFDFDKRAVAVRSPESKSDDPEKGEPLSLQAHSEAIDRQLQEAGRGLEEEDEEEEEEESEHSQLTPRQIKTKAFLLILFGVALVTVFSDPMVDVLKDVGQRTHIQPFFISFIVSPLASNASEFISSIVFAMKRTRGSITMTYTALEGAATMNNTFCLSIFLILIYSQGLEWTFSAETLAILVVEVIMCIITWNRRFYPTWLSIVIVSLFPLSIALVVFMEKVVGWK